MWKIVILALACYIVYKLFANDILKKKKVAEKEEKAETERKIAAGEMVKDPECGTWVSVEDSPSVKDGNKSYYFCSYDCRDSFLKKLKEGGRQIPHQEP